MDGRTGVDAKRMRARKGDDKKRRRSERGRLDNEQVLARDEMIIRRTNIPCNQYTVSSVVAF